MSAGATTNHRKSAKERDPYFTSQLYVKDPGHRKSQLYVEYIGHRKPVFFLTNGLSKPEERAHYRN